MMPFNGAESEIAPVGFGNECISDAAELLSALEKSRVEYDRLQHEKQKLE